MVAVRRGPLPHGKADGLAAGPIRECCDGMASTAVCARRWRAQTFAPCTCPWATLNRVRPRRLVAVAWSLLRYWRASVFSRMAAATSSRA